MSNSSMESFSNLEMPDDALLARYFSGAATEEDNARIYSWLGDNPERRKQLDFWAEIWRESPDAAVRGDADAVWRAIQCRTGVGVRTITPAIRTARVGAWIGLAAAAAIAIGVFGSEYVPDIFTPPVHPSVTYSTPVGQRANVTLADGSKVVLAPATVMRVMGKDGRSIELNGEAVFIVVNHDKEPFTVRAGSTVTRVLGTTFGVRSYNDEVRVAVRDGRVSVGTATLSSRDVAVIQGDKTTIYHNADVDALTAWTAGRIVFSDTPTAVVLAELRRWYNLDWRIDPKIPQRHITASFEIGPVSDVLGVLAPAMGVRYRQIGRVVELFP